MSTKSVPAGASVTNLDELTSLRFFAAFAVLLSHLDFLGSHANKFVSGLYHHVFSQGFCGVAFFYVLSGFIISYAYQTKLTSGATSRVEYLLLRIARIAPLHVLTGLFFLAYVVLIKKAEPEPLTWFLNLTLLQSWSTDPHTYFSLNAPSWSLSNELFFYVSFIFLVTLSTRTLAGIAVILGTTLIALATWFAIQPKMLPITEWLFYVNPFARILEFITGMLMYRARQAGRLRPLANTASELTLLAAIPFLMFAFTAMEVPMPFRWQLAYLPVMACTVLIFSYGRGAVSRLLRNRTLVFLGLASFSLYLVHRPLITLVHQLSERFLDERHDVLLAVSLVVMSVLASVIAYRIVEKPIHNRLKNGIARPHPEITIAARERV